MLDAGAMDALDACLRLRPGNVVARLPEGSRLPLLNPVDLLRALGEAHVAIGRALRDLRDQGVLIFATGNATHNLQDAFRHLGNPNAPTPDWARRFDADIVRGVEQRDPAFLVQLATTPDGRVAHPSPDHYLPLLYVVGAADARDAISYPIEGFDAGSLSMRAIRWG